MLLLEQYVDKNNVRIREQFEALVAETPSRLTMTCLVVLAAGYFVEMWIALVTIFFMVLDDIILLRGAKAVISGCSLRCYVIVVISNTICTAIFSVFFCYVALQSEDDAALMYSALVLMACFVQIATARAADIAHGLLSALPINIGIVLILGHQVLITQTNWISQSILICTIIAANVYVGFMFVESAMLRIRLERQTRRAEEANRSKSRFLAAMSHEIRTPLNGIYGTAQILMNTEDPHARQERTQLLVNAAAGLKSIVDDIIEHSRIEEGKFTLQPEDTNIRDFVKQQCELYRANAEAKGLALSVTWAHELPEEAHFDPIRAGQVLNNLMSNAVKYTSSGQINVHVRYHEGLNNSGIVDIAVTDTGPGLTEEEQAQVFGSYVQVERLMNHAVGGAGLGLAIARELSLLMEGEIRLESQPGQGSTFSFLFRVDASRQSQIATIISASGNSEKQHASAFEGLRVLVVDDVDINRIVTKNFLEPCGIEIIEAQNGKEALDILAQTPIDLILLDQQMPIMTGHEMLQLLRDMPSPLNNLPVIAVTAGTLDRERQEFMSLGLDGFLAKPIERTSLLEEMGNAIRKRAALGQRMSA